MFKIIIVILLVFIAPTLTHNAFAFEWLPPTTRFMEEETWPKIDEGLRANQVSTEYRDFFDQIAKEEHIGFFGYHGTTQEFRIYQDIVRLLIEEAVQIPIRPDFHFMRVPGEPRYLYHSIKEYGNYLNDYSPTDFICLNYSIYSNYNSDFYSTYFYFATNNSSSSINFEEKLHWLFERLGIDQSAIYELFTLGRQYVGVSKTGVVFQFFDTSHHNGHSYYEFVDPILGTFAHNDMVFSKVIEGTKPSHFYLQLRLLMSNSRTLNPYAPIAVKRFDLIDPEVAKQYESAMRKYIKTLKVDSVKAKSYADDLKKLWTFAMAKSHLKARTGQPEGYPQRTKVPSDQVSWNVLFPEYSPVAFTHKSVLARPAWADPADFSEVTRALSSYEGNIQFDSHTGLPLNPYGRTGIQGRGLLGKWGPNFAADPIITRINPATCEIEMLAIQRKDNGEWAIPGGMVEAGDDIPVTLMKELSEETAVVLDMSHAREVYKGYVDDPRNTDNAWLETVVKHVHLSAEDAAQLHPKAGSDAAAVQWMPLTDENVKKLYANHGEFVSQALERLKPEIEKR